MNYYFKYLKYKKKYLKLKEQHIGGANSDEIIIDDRIIGPSQYDSKGLTKIKFTENVKIINNNAFSNNKIKSLVIPDTVESIGNNAFSNNQIKSLVIPDTVKNIGNNAFSGNHLESIKINPKLIYNNKWANIFGVGLSTKNICINDKGKKCEKISTSESLNKDAEKISTPESFKKEAQKISTKCNAILTPKRAHIDATPSENMIEPFYCVIGKDAYNKKLQKLNRIIIPENIITIEESAFQENLYLKEVIFGTQIKEIQKSAFKDCKLIKLELPESLTTIGESAFSYNEIESLEIPETEISIGKSAFSNNKIVSLKIPNTVTTISDSVFSNNHIKELKISESVTTIGESAFSKNKIESLKIPESVTTIGESAFSNNEIVSLEIPENGISIGKSAFSNNKIVSLKIPNTLTTIRESVFSNNYIKELIIPKSVTTIGDSAFSNNKIVSLNILNTKISIGKSVFSNNILQKVNIPDKFMTRKIINDIFNEIIVDAAGNIIEVINLINFNNCGYPISKFVCNTNHIHEYEFADLHLSKIGTLENDIIILGETFPPKINNIGNSAFAFNKLEKIVLPPNLTELNDFVFSYNLLKEIIIPDRVSKIGNCTFCNNKLRKLEIKGNNLLKIGEYAFSGNELEEIIIPEKVNLIGNFAFYKNKLKKVTIPEKFMDINIIKKIFDNLESITFNNSKIFSKAEIETLSNTEIEPLSKAEIKTFIYHIGKDDPDFIIIDKTIIYTFISFEGDFEKEIEINKPNTLIYIESNNNIKCINKFTEYISKINHLKSKLIIINKTISKNCILYQQNNKTEIEIYNIITKYINLNDTLYIKTAESIDPNKVYKQNTFYYINKEIFNRMYSLPAEPESEIVNLPKFGNKGDAYNIVVMIKTNINYHKNIAETWWYKLYKTEILNPKKLIFN